MVSYQNIPIKNGIENIIKLMILLQNLCHSQFFIEKAEAQKDKRTEEKNVEKGKSLVFSAMMEGEVQFHTCIVQIPSNTSEYYLYYSNCPENCSGYDIKDGSAIR